jgi:hypothetical protein
MTNSIEMTVIATDEAPEQTMQERLRFQLDFMLMMLNVGRDKEANEACARLYNLIDEMEG